MDQHVIVIKSDDDDFKITVVDEDDIEDGDMIVGDDDFKIDIVRL